MPSLTEHSSGQFTKPRNKGLDARWPKRTEEQRFREFVAVRDSGCHEWVGYRDPNGYGRFDGKLAHRKAWQLSGKILSKGLSICHHCDNPRCVNPDHLFEGTHKENMEDAARKNRMGRPLKLSDDVLRAIVVGIACGIPGKDLAEEFGVSKALISKIKNGGHKRAKSI